MPFGFPALMESYKNKKPEENANILSKIFNCDLPGKYTKDDLDYAQLNYISSESFSFEALIQSYALCPEIVVDTLAVLFDNVEISHLKCFPFHVLCSFIDKGDFERIKMVQQLCEQREGIFINVLYSVAFKTNESTSKYFSNLSLVLGFKNCWKFLENRELWGLERPKAGFYTKHDEDILIRVKTQNFDINAYRRSSDSQYTLPFFLQSAFSLVSGFDPEDHIDQRKILEIRNIIDQTYECLFPLLAVLTIKNNFCDLIKNAYSQDRTKLKFERENNCSDSFCYTSCILLLKIGVGTFNSSFIHKIDDKKFPTFCFFYISRLLEISICKLIEDVKEEYNQNNSMYLIANEEVLIQKYLNFVYDLISERRSEVFATLLAKHKENEDTKDDTSMPSNGSPSILNNCSPNINLPDNPISNIEDVDFLVEFPGVLPVFIEDKKAACVKEILSDHSFISTILSVQSILSRRTINGSARTLIDCVFGYKNTFKRYCLHVLRKYPSLLSSVTVRRIVLHYTDKSDEDIYNDRFAIHEILRDCELEPSKDSLRMISFALGSFEERLSLIFDSIMNIKAYKSKDLKLNEVFRGSDEDFYISEDEEEIQMYPENFLTAMSLLNDSQLLETIKNKVAPSKADAVIQEIRTQIKIRKNPFKVRLYKKIKVNTLRIEKHERILKSSAIYLDSLLKFLQNFTRINKRLFLNKHVFFRMFSIINSSLNLLVGEQSLKIKLQNKEEYQFHPKEILRMVILIVINILKNNAKLVQASGVDRTLLERALDLARAKHIIMEDQILDLAEISRILSEISAENNINNAIINDDIPEEFLDPLTFTIMENPVLMLTSKITIDRSTFNQIMLNDQIDPFSRLPLDESKIVDNAELKEKIDHFKKEGLI